MSRRQVAKRFVTHKVFPVVVVLVLLLVFTVTLYSMYVKSVNPDYAQLDLTELCWGDEKFVADLAMYNNKEVLEQFSILDLEPRHYITIRYYVVNGTYNIFRAGLWGEEYSTVTIQRCWLVRHNVTGQLVFKVPLTAFQEGIYQGHYK